MDDTIITEDQFEERYKPRPNHIDDSHGFDMGSGCCLFETYGEELAYVQAQPENTVWTILDGDEGLTIVSGIHYVNQFGYIISEIPFDEKQSISVTLDGLDD